MRDLIFGPRACDEAELEAEREREGERVGGAGGVRERGSEGGRERKRECGRLKSFHRHHLLWWQPDTL